MFWPIYLKWLEIFGTVSAPPTVAASSIFQALTIYLFLQANKLLHFRTIYIPANPGYATKPENVAQTKISIFFLSK